MLTVPRGGVPRIRRRTITTTGQKESFAPTMRLQISNEGANVLRLYFTQADFDADSAGAGTDGFLALAATTGFFDGTVEVENVWLRSVVGPTTAVVLLTLQR